MMRRPAVLVSTVAILLLVPLASCTATPTAPGGPAPSSTAAPVTPDPMDAAEQQAQAWLDAAVVPPGAVRVSESPGEFYSYQGWPCQPVAELEGYWTLADATVPQAANWLRDNPTADLVSTAGPMRVEEDSPTDAAIVGYIPADESQQGIVYTVAKADSGVIIRAEVAALAESAVCPSMEPGSTLGKPGQG